MPRKVRELEDNGIYHIYNRGNNKAPLFRDKNDFDIFRHFWLEAKARFEFDVFHYCWMNNHYHVLLKIRFGDDLGKILHWVQLAYAKYFKKKYETVGHLFQERYRSPRITEESYYLQCGRYIERNPVTAKIVLTAEEYEYSSARYYALGHPDDFLTDNFYYTGLGKTPEERQTRYLSFLCIEDPYQRMVDEALLKV